MKKLFLLTCLALGSFIGCKDQQASKAQKVEQEAIKTAQKTYAEISIGQGGTWKDRKYEGRTSFKNVSSLRVPDSHTDHSYFIRYEGPGWESNKVGYRIYLDWRNAIDIFGKLTDAMVLPQVGQDNFDSYHEPAPWGMDILKVGKSLGIGSYGRYDRDKVHHFEQLDSTLVHISNDKKGADVTIMYYGWDTQEVKADLSANLSIAPDSRMTKVHLNPSAPIPGLATGIVKFDSILPIHQKTDKKWSYMATYGVQTLVPDKLGMALFYQNDQVAETITAAHDHLLVFNTSDTPVTYYLLGAWEQEPGGIKNKEDFIAYLEQELNRLNQ